MGSWLKYGDVTFKQAETALLEPELLWLKGRAKRMKLRPEELLRNLVVYAMAEDERRKLVTVLPDGRGGWGIRFDLPDQA